MYNSSKPKILLVKTGLVILSLLAVLLIADLIFTFVAAPVQSSPDQAANAIKPTATFAVGAIPPTATVANSNNTKSGITAVSSAPATSAATPVSGMLTPLPATPARPAPTPVTTPALPTRVGASVPITFSGKGTVEDGTFHSPILNRNMVYRIYLPPAYRTNPGQHFPVLYMLHGMSGSYLEWIDYHLFDIADDMISKGQIKPVIIVLPSGDKEFWVDHANNGPQWGQYVVQDVVGFIDASYRTIPNRDNRAVGGHSMGGHGALQLAFNHPNVFGIVGAHSPTLRTKDQAPDYFGDEVFYEAHDPVSLSKTAPNLKTLKIWFDIGDQDKEWVPRVEELDKALTSRNIPHTFHEWPGDHGADYWISHVPDYLRFYTGNMSGSSPASTKG
jgi:enterochelin esterase-like enzyme